MKNQLTAAERLQVDKALHAPTLVEALEETPKVALDAIVGFDPKNPEADVAGDLFDSPLFSGK